MADSDEKKIALYGIDLFGDPQAGPLRGILAKRFLVPPFTVLIAAAGWWQNRKKAWKDIGIQSELGRGLNVLGHPETTGNMGFYKEKRALEAELGRELETEEAIEELIRLGRIGRMDRPGMDSGAGRDHNLTGLSAACEQYRQRKGEYTSGDARTFGSGDPGDLSAEMKRREKKITPGGGGGPRSCYYRTDGTGSFQVGEGAVQKGKRVDGGNGNHDLRDGMAFRTTPDPYNKQFEKKAKAKSRAYNDHEWLLTANGDVPVEGSGTSIFDPVLCELVYRWFCPVGGQVVDPFAGGSVRGLVAGFLGRRYWGSELSAEQVQANEAQSLDLFQHAVPQVELWEGDEVIKDKKAKGGKRLIRFNVVRDDRVPGGTKERALRVWLATRPEQEVVYASPAQGFAQVAIARVARELGKKATIFTAHRAELSDLTYAAQAAGADIGLVKPGYLTVVEKRARDHATEKGAYLVPFGLDCPEFLAALVKVVRSTELPEDYEPSEVWVAAGSGTLCRAIQKAWPKAEVHAVAVGREPDVGDAILHRYDLEYEKPGRVKPPFPSNPNYEAKAWEMMLAEGGDGALFWNTAPDYPTIQWVNEDSAVSLDIAPDADLVFSCPPYFDLEVYSDQKSDLSNMKWEEFLPAYYEIIRKACERLRPNRFAAFVVGDVRDDSGNYVNLPAITTAAFEAAGLSYYNETVLVTSVGSLPIRVTRQFEVSRKLGKTHQNLLVYVKGDPKKAVDAVTGMTVAERLKKAEKDVKNRTVAWEEPGTPVATEPQEET